MGENVVKAGLKWPQNSSKWSKIGPKRADCADYGLNFEAQSFFEIICQAGHLIMAKQWPGSGKKCIFQHILGASFLHV